MAPRYSYDDAVKYAWKHNCNPFKPAAVVTVKNTRTGKDEQFRGPLNYHMKAIGWGVTMGTSRYGGHGRQEPMFEGWEWAPGLPVPNKEIDEYNIRLMPVCKPEDIEPVTPRYGPSDPITWSDSEQASAQKPNK